MYGDTLLQRAISHFREKIYGALQRRTIAQSIARKRTVCKDAFFVLALQFTLMDGEKDRQREKTGTWTKFQPWSNAPSDSSSMSLPREETDWEGMFNTERQNRGDLGDMTFHMANYLKDAMKMMFIMRSHHMLTDVILEVGTELFHAHKVILAAASPYFKVRARWMTMHNGCPV